MSAKRLLLHACCAPCLTVPYKRLLSDYDVDVFFYNPNIHPQKEYEDRDLEIHKLGDKWDFEVQSGEYDQEEWFELVQGLEDEPERGRRCDVCYEMRLRKTAQVAAERGYDAFTTTLTLSPLKNAETINRIGAEIGRVFDVLFLESNFKKQDGVKESNEISREEGLYRQDYCGCIYSQRDAFHLTC